MAQLTTIKEQTVKAQQNLVNVAECLYRSDITKRYYGITKRGGKQKKKSLKTTDRQLAEQRLKDWLGKAAKLDTGNGARVAFTFTNQRGKIVGDLLHQYLQLKIDPLQPNTRALNLADCQSFTLFGDKPVRSNTLKDVETWAARRRQQDPLGRPKPIIRQKVHLQTALDRTAEDHRVVRRDR